MCTGLQALPKITAPIARNPCATEAGRKTRTEIVRSGPRMSDSAPALAGFFQLTVVQIVRCTGGRRS
jgi:hypothetical protein